jgi:mannosyltransferase OCH1-like enzyme
MGKSKRHQISDFNTGASQHFPKLVHQTWKRKELPTKFQQWRQECIRLNPDYQFWLWTDDENRQLVASSYPHLLIMYDKYDAHIKRVDVARYLILHQFGGVYMDLDIACLKPFRSYNETGLFDHHGRSFYVAEQGDRRRKLFYRNFLRGKEIANAFLASPSKHPLLDQLIDDLPRTAHLPVLEATGPSFLTRHIKQVNKSVCNIQMLDFETVYAQDYRKNGGGCETLQDCRLKFRNSTCVSFWTGSWIPGQNASKLL